MGKVQGVSAVTKETMQNLAKRKGESQAIRVVSNVKQGKREGGGDSNHTHGMITCHDETKHHQPGKEEYSLNGLLSFKYTQRLQSIDVIK